MNPSTQRILLQIEWKKIHAQLVFHSVADLEFCIGTAFNYTKVIIILVTSLLGESIENEDYGGCRNILSLSKGGASEELRGAGVLHDQMKHPQFWMHELWVRGSGVTILSLNHRFSEREGQGRGVQCHAQPKSTNDIFLPAQVFGLRAINGCARRWPCQPIQEKLAVVMIRWHFNSF